MGKAGDSNQKKGSPESSENSSQEKQSLEYREASFSLPLHSPQFLEQYKQIDPSFPERILKMTEKEGEHRRKREDAMIDHNREVAEYNYRTDQRGQIFGLVAVVLVLFFCAYIASLGYAKTAAAVATAVIVSLAAIFVTGRFLSKNKRNNNHQSQESE